jgi:CRP/FNR family transcriptional regulator, cyclic AMP receptor protein
MTRGIPADVIRHFQAIPLFSSLSKAGLRSVIQAGGEIDRPAGSTLVREGDDTHEMAVLVSGSARVTRRGRKLRDLGPGDFFGEIAFLTRAERTATVTASTDVRLIVLGARELEGVVKQEPRIAVQMLASVASRMRETERSRLA